MLRPFTFYQARFSLEGFCFLAIFDGQGLLWHLQFGNVPSLYFKRRLFRDNLISCEKAPEDLLSTLKEALKAYFCGRSSRLVFPHHLVATPFEAKVLRLVCQIPYGEVRTYGWVAHALGRAGAARAVGQALARNPLPLVYPCHRVVGRQGLGGFSAGVSVKRRLLSLEGISLASAS